VSGSNRKTRKTSSPWTVTLSCRPGEFFTGGMFLGDVRRHCLGLGENFCGKRFNFSAGRYPEEFPTRAVVQGAYRDLHALQYRLQVRTCSGYDIAPPSSGSDPHSSTKPA